MVNRAKPGQKLFIFSIFSAHISLVYSNFNFEELYDVKYGFEISKEPVLLREVGFFFHQCCNTTLPSVSFSLISCHTRRPGQVLFSS